MSTICNIILFTLHTYIMLVYYKHVVIQRFSIYMYVNSKFPDQPVHLLSHQGNMLPFFKLSVLTVFFFLHENMHEWQTV